MIGFGVTRFPCVLCDKNGRHHSCVQMNPFLLTIAISTYATSAPSFPSNHRGFQPADRPDGSNRGPDHGAPSAASDGHPLDPVEGGRRDDLRQHSGLRRPTATIGVRPQVCPLLSAGRPLTLVQIPNERQPAVQRFGKQRVGLELKSSARQSSSAAQKPLLMWLTHSSRPRFGRSRLRSAAASTRTSETSEFLLNCGPNEGINGLERTRTSEWRSRNPFINLMDVIGACVFGGQNPLLLGYFRRVQGFGGR